MAAGCAILTFKRRYDHVRAAVTKVYCSTTVNGRSNFQRRLIDDISHWSFFFCFYGHKAYRGKGEQVQAVKTEECSGGSDSRIITKKIRVQQQAAPDQASICQSSSY